jgi:hypothetical protein
MEEVIGILIGIFEENSSCGVGSLKRPKGGLISDIQIPPPLNSLICNYKDMKCTIEY